MEDAFLQILFFKVTSKSILVSEKHYQVIYLMYGQQPGPLAERYELLVYITINI